MKISLYSLDSWCPCFSERVLVRRSLDPLVLFYLFLNYSLGSEESGGERLTEVWVSGLGEQGFSEFRSL